MATAVRPKPEKPVPPPRPPGERFKSEIESARSEGVEPGVLLLRLTLGDVSRLKRDPAISVSDISFADGEMHYLGVKIAAGGVDASSLVILQS
ncbi:MAG TPA: hypothetical protein VGI95_21025 [Caulobacteraceae bacterium]|jgi:hypothetical protein